MRGTIRLNQEIGKCVRIVISILPHWISRDFILTPMTLKIEGG
jgi:hypothetical protein